MERGGGRGVRYGGNLGKDWSREARRRKREERQDGWREQCLGKAG